MKKLLFLLTLFTVIVFSCTLQNNSTLKNKQYGFKEYLNSLDTIPLPFSHFCGNVPFPTLSAHFDSAGFKKYKHVWTVKPLGILFNDKQNIVTVDLSIGDYYWVPFLVSFDQNGHKLDSLGPYDHGGQDSDVVTKPYLKVFRNKHFLVVDTTKQWKLDFNGKEVPGSETISTDSSVYVLSKKGKFIKEATRKK